ncbi:AP2/ERF and B3 domain-containing transcription factor [Acorus calamus]|uniref:AP2/ERF and B3 domain-containing transcription factor n=1 Tax=Acorus calamus TaxID=4465 RepID=A0AAV9FKR9_ACOCL|nr:AP2/ERF and B3 domain-containing transcription factor [Acorus calamus]
MTSYAAPAPTAADVIEASGSNSTSEGDPIDRPITGPPTLGPSARYKGVVVQQNGNWGAQIYADHRRVWLGTFKTEREAAMAYDAASIKLRSGDTHRNFPWTDATSLEPRFQELYTKEAVLAMIRDGSYPARFTHFLQAVRMAAAPPPAVVAAAKGGVVQREMFRKELTPSDVGKLNRLVIPKKHAVAYFPRAAAEEERSCGGGVSGGGDVGVVFVDRRQRTWTFRYCYWKSSQSYVFTRGWNRYVRVMDLRPMDIVVFYQCEEVGGARRVFRMIDVEYTGPRVRGGGDGGGGEDLRLRLGPGGGGEEEMVEKVVEEEEEEVEQVVKEEAVWLFGVRIG